MSQSIADLRQQFYGGLASEVASLQSLYDAGITFDKLLQSADFDALTTGESTIPRRDVTGSSGGAVASGTMPLTFFTARKTETITQVKVRSGNVAAAATPTLVRLGIYSIAANGDGTLVASIANDITVYAATFTGYQRTLIAPFAKVAGQRYAFGRLVVTAAAVPTAVGNNTSGVADSTSPPRLMGSVTALADLPATFTEVSLVNAVNSQTEYATLLP